MKKFLVLICCVLSFQFLTAQQSWLMTGNSNSQGSQVGSFLTLGTTEPWANPIHFVTGGQKVMTISEPYYQPTDGMALIINPQSFHNSTFKNYGTGVTISNAHINLVGDGPWSNQIRFYRRNVGGIKHMIFDEGPSLTIQPGTDAGGSGIVRIAGRLQVGNGNAPAGYGMYVQTGILTERIKVATINSSDWMDKVFSKGYKLMSLKELDEFISKNKHLPEMPSGEDVEKNGLDLAQMDAKLLQKVEELTLHLIELSKKVEILEAENKKLKKK